MRIPLGLISSTLVLSCWAAAPLRAERVTASQINPERELLITSAAVVDSPPAQYPGPWSFGSLVEQIAGPGKASACIGNWLKTWTEAVTVNEQLVMPRAGIKEKVIGPWQKRDGYDPASGVPWEPNLAHAPFRLLAIVNRMDLCAPNVAGTVRDVQEQWRLHHREKEFLLLFNLATGQQSVQSAGYGFGGLEALKQKRPISSAGEGRFVFGAVDETGKPLGAGWTVILEFVLPAIDEAGIRTWAESWHRLGGIDPQDPSFLIELEHVTRTFSHENLPLGGSPHLSQLRSSEAIFGEGREFRQFGFSGGEFTPEPLTQTPSPAFSQNHSPYQRLLTAFLHVEDPLIRSGIHELPDSLRDTRKSYRVLAGHAFIPTGAPNFHWEAGPQVSRDARRIFSLNTCNGCHAGETACKDGLHIHPRAAGTAAALSDFLRTDRKSLRINDPDIRGSKIEYQEIEDRAAILAAFLAPKDRFTLEALRPILRDRLARTH